MVRYRWYHAEQKHNLYTLVEAVSPPQNALSQAECVLVEAPGTAPGSEKLIIEAIYHHSQLVLTPKI